MLNLFKANLRLLLFSVTSVKRVHCMKCDRWVLRYYFAEHQRRHNKVRPFCCEVGRCNKSFCKLRELQIHVYSVHEKRQPFKCDQCHRRFSEKGNLNVHITAVHDKQRPFKCEQCQKTFNNPSNLHRHVRCVHDKLKPHACPYCTYRCNRAGNLLRHYACKHKHQTMLSTTKREFIIYI